MSDKNGIEHPKENWTRFPNCILDNLDRYNANEIKVLAFIIRKTLGWQSEPNYMFAAEYVAAKLDMSEKTARTAIDGLEQSGSIKNTGREGKMGVKLYKVNWIRPVKITDRIKGERPVKITGDARQNLPTVLETNHKETSNADALSMHPKTFEQEKKKTKILKTEDKELSTSIYEILDKSKYTIEHSKTLTNKIAVAVRRHGLEALKKAVSSRIQYQASAGRDLYIHHFLADAPAIEWHIARSQTLPTPTKSNLPDFSHIQYDDAPFDEHAMDEFKVTHA